MGNDMLTIPPAFGFFRTAEACNSVITAQADAVKDQAEERAAAIQKQSEKLNAYR
jgi:hypothetical protein